MRATASRKTGVVRVDRKPVGHFTEIYSKYFVVMGYKFTSNCGSVNFENISLTSVHADSGGNWCLLSMVLDWVDGKDISKLILDSQDFMERCKLRLNQ